MCSDGSNVYLEGFGTSQKRCLAQTNPDPDEETPKQKKARKGHAKVELWVPRRNQKLREQGKLIILSRVFHFVRSNFEINLHTPCRLTIQGLRKNIFRKTTVCG